MRTFRLGVSYYKYGRILTTYSGKISVHGNGVGVPTPEQVEARAREIALIDERDPDEFTDADWDQARRELLGEVVSPPPEEDEKTIRMEEEWEVTPDDHGHRVPRPGWMRTRKRSVSISLPTVSKKPRMIKCSRRARKNSSRRAELLEFNRGRDSEKDREPDDFGVVDLPPAAQSRAGGAPSLLARFHEVRDFSTKLSANLEPEDCVVQSMPDVSPTKWHLAHTTWFFETFILKKWVPGYQSEIPEYAYLFNSYYNAAGDMHRRDLRGLISRPTVQESHRYRASINSYIDNLLSDADEKLLAEIEPILTLGIHHEQQHQELLVTDIKHVFAQNPLHPIYRERKIDKRKIDILPLNFVDFDEATVEIGHDGSGFSYDNEGPRHRALVLPFFAVTSSDHEWRVSRIH